MVRTSKGRKVIHIKMEKQTSTGKEGKANKYWRGCAEKGALVH